VGLAIALALFAGYPVAQWLARQRTLRMADRIAHSFATEQALAQASPALRDKLERYRVAKVRASLGAPARCTQPRRSPLASTDWMRSNAVRR
jgi:hypothetical protein